MPLRKKLIRSMPTANPSHPVASVSRHHGTRRRPMRLRLAWRARHEICSAEGHDQAVPPPRSRDRRLSRDQDGEPADEAALHHRGACGPQLRNRARARRDRHRQGARRSRAAHAEPARRQAVPSRQLRDPQRRAARLGAVRPRKRRLHRRDPRPQRPVRSRTRRHHLPRRDRRPPARHPGAPLARGAGAQLHAARHHRREARRRAHDLRHQQRPAATRGSRGSSARI